MSIEDSIESENKPLKGYKIDLNRINEGFLYSDVICHAESLNQARSILLKKSQHDGMELLSGKDFSYTTIPVVRCHDADLHNFEGQFLTQREIEDILTNRKRLDYFKGILEDPAITHCYIRKHGSYYRPNACGYTSLKIMAGIYEKVDAVNHGKSCSDLQIIPINQTEHNQFIQEAINELQSRII